MAKRVPHKLGFSIATAISIVVLGVLAAVFPVLGPYLGTLIMGLVSVLGIFCGANIGATWVNGNAQFPDQQAIGGPPANPENEAE